MKRLFKKQMNKRSHKKRLFLIALLSILAAALIAVLVWNKVAPELANQCRGTANSPLYAESASLANDSLLTTTNEEVAQNIEKNNGYKNDVNCLYPLMSYYMKKKDADKVKTLFGLYGLAYGDDKKVEKMYKGYDVRSYEDVKKQVEVFLKGDGSVDAIYY